MNERKNIFSACTSKFPQDPIPLHIQKKRKNKENGIKLFSTVDKVNKKGLESKVGLNTEQLAEFE